MMYVNVVVCLCLYAYRFLRHFPCCKTWWIKNLNMQQESMHSLSKAKLTPSLPQPVIFPGWKIHGRACKQYHFYFQSDVFVVCWMPGVFLFMCLDLVLQQCFNPMCLWCVECLAYSFLCVWILFYNNVSMRCVSKKILSHASAKKKTEIVTGFKFCTFIGRLWSDILAVKGLSILDRGYYVNAWPFRTRLCARPEISSVDLPWDFTGGFALRFWDFTGGFALRFALRCQIVFYSVQTLSDESRSPCVYNYTLAQMSQFRAC